MNPDKFPRDATSIFIHGPEGLLETKTAEPKQQAAQAVTVILCHPHPLHQGTMENKVITTLFRSFRDLGVRVVRFNYRGVGKSEGSYGHALGETDDVIAIIQWVKQVRPGDQIWLVGFSFGSYVAMRATSLMPEAISQLLTIAPAVQHADFNSLTPPSCPWVVIQGDADEHVSPERVFQWVESQSNPPKLIKLAGVGHFFHRRLLDLKHVIEETYEPFLN